MFAAHVITGFLLDRIYLTLKIRIWLKDNFVLLVGYMSCYKSFLQKSGGFGIASTAIPSLQTKGLKKRASHPHATYICI